MDIKLQQVPENLVPAQKLVAGVKETLEYAPINMCSIFQGADIWCNGIGIYGDVTFWGIGVKDLPFSPPPD